MGITCKEVNMIDTTVRKLLIGGNDEDCKVASAMLSKRDILREGLYSFEDPEFWEKTMHLEKVRHIQDKWTTSVIAGSIGLFLNGCRVERWRHNGYRPDLDIIIPFYQSMKDARIKESGAWGLGSGNDFDEKFIIDGQIGLDLRIDPKSRYTLIDYNGYQYKVANCLDAIEAKIKYSRQSGGDKHRQDLWDIIGKTTFDKVLEKAKISTEMTL